MLLTTILNVFILYNDELYNEAPEISRTFMEDNESVMHFYGMVTLLFADSLKASFHGEHVF